MSYRYYLGIDPGVKTGLALYDTQLKNYHTIQTYTILQAQNWIYAFENKDMLFVRMEDARLRTWFGNADARQQRSGAGIREGVGSVKRDCQIWEEFLQFNCINYELVAPKNNTTKLDAKRFNLITGWKTRTSEHARDAAGLLFRYMDCKKLKIQ